MIKKIIVFLVLICSVSFGKVAYKVESLNIVANIQKDGSIDVEERVVYDIEKVNGILYNIDALGHGKLNNLEVFYEENGEYKPAIKNNLGRKGNFTLNVNDGVYKIKLYLPVFNERKNFLFRYNLSRGVTVYRDIAQLNRKMVGKGWNVPIKNINVSINLPTEVPKDEIYAFGHGPLTGNIDIVDDGTIEYTLNNYLPREFVEVNLLFPKEILTEFNPLLMKNQKALKSILEMERDLAKQANEKRKKAKIKLFMSKGIFSIGIVWWLFLLVFIYKRNSKRYKVENEYGEYFRELPDNYSPSVAGTLLSKSIYPGSKELFAMLLELVRKGYLRLEEEDNKTTLILEEKGNEDLSDEEKFILNWYIRELGDGEKVVLEEIEKLVKNRGKAKEFNSNYERWKTMVYSDMLAKNLKMDKRDKISTTLGIVTGVAYFIGGAFLISYFRTTLFLAFIPLGFVLIPYTFSRKRASLEKEKAISRWKAFKKFLVDYSNLEEAKLASIQLWEHYFVYAVALGVAEKVAKAYNKIMSEKGVNSEGSIILNNHRRSNLMNTYMYSRAFQNMERSINNVNREVLSNIANSSRSSTSGRGGGFSGGSSGGGGGRSGGGAF